MNKKTFIPIIFVLLSLFIPLVSAQSSVMWINTSNYYNYNAQISSSAVSTFADGNDQYLSVVQFYVNVSGVQSGIVNCKVYYTNNTANPFMLDSLTLMANSSQIDIATLSDGNQWITFTFDRTLLVNETAGRHWGITLDPISATAGLKYYYDSDGSASYGMYTLGIGGSFPTAMCMKVWTTSTAGSGGGATPRPGDDVFGDSPIAEMMNKLLPTLIPLILVLLCAFLGWKFAGPWGFFAGINVGYVICIIVDILPLWGMIVLLVVDGLLLFGKVGFRT